MTVVLDSPQHLLRDIVLVGQPAENGAHLRGALLDYAEAVSSVETPAAALEEVRHNKPELVVVLEDVPADGAVRLVEQIANAAPDCRVIVIARRGSVQRAVRAIKAGACDYLCGPLDLDALRSVLRDVQREIGRAGAVGSRYFCRERPPDVPIVGRSPAIVEALAAIRLVSESRCNPILLLGETGTGKELAARAVHAWRCGDPEKLVAVNCAALTANLLESELFGHVRGAFTGADRDKTGLFELAGSGTIFLDEISEMPLELQAKLLRVLQDGTFRKVGGTKDLKCNATVVTSSNRDLLAEVEAGRFRKDLYYRLAVFPITLAPLRSQQRRSDIGLLAAYFLETSTVCARSDVEGLTPAAEQALMDHTWPGNVRELRNVMDRALILEQGSRITPESLRLGPCEAAPAAPGSVEEPKPRPKKDFSLETAERQFILRALNETGWQRTRAAALLGITRATLHAKLKRYDIQPPGSPSGGRTPSPPAAGRRNLQGSTA